MYRLRGKKAKLLEEFMNLKNISLFFIYICSFNLSLIKFIFAVFETG